MRFRLTTFMFVNETNLMVQSTGVPSPATWLGAG